MIEEETEGERSGSRKQTLTYIGGQNGDITLIQSWDYEAQKVKINKGGKPPCSIFS